MKRWQLLMIHLNGFKKRYRTMATITGAIAGQIHSEDLRCSEAIYPVFVLPTFMGVKLATARHVHKRANHNSYKIFPEENFGSWFSHATPSKFIFTWILKCYTVTLGTNRSYNESTRTAIRSAKFKFTSQETLTGSYSIIAQRTNSSRTKFLRHESLLTQ